MREQKVNRESHTWVQQRLSEYLDNRLSPLERVQIERHVQVCHECQRELDSLRWTVTLLQQAPKPQLTRQFTLPVSATRPSTSLFGLSALRLATALATLILVSLVGIDLIMQLGGGAASAPTAQMRSAEVSGETRAAFAVGTPTEPNRDLAPSALQVPSQPAATSAPVAPAAQPTSAPKATAAPAAATAAALPSATPSVTAPKAFSLPPSATRNGIPTATPTPTAAMSGLGAGPISTLPASKATDSLETTSVPTAPPPTESPTLEPSPTLAPSVAPPTATATPHVEVYLQPTVAALGQTDTGLTDQGGGGIEPLRIAELVMLFVTVFLGALLALLGLRR